LDFENINRIPFHYNKKALKAIVKADANQRIEELNDLLEDYISKFGILNFRHDKDLVLVWKLGQVKEVLGDTNAALYFYSLAIKNHYRFYDQVKIHFDALRKQWTNEYVDLDYYYKLVAARLQIDTLAPPQEVLLALGDQVNTKYPDYAPYMHPTNSVLIFTSRRTPSEPTIYQNFGENEDLYYTEVDILYGGYTFATRFPDEINSRLNEGSACLNYQGTMLYFARCNDPKGYGVCDLYSSEFVNGRWTNVQNLGPNINGESWDSHPSITPDGNRLYFASNRMGGFGRTDIYYSDRLDDGSWGPAQNAGPIINTIEDEVTPFYHPIYQTLYFSSTGHLYNKGGFDIYKTRWLGSRWEEPRNLGPLVNTRGDEYYFCIDARGDTLFYAKAKPEDPKNFDIYSFPMPMGARPDAVVSLRGYLIDSVSGFPLTGIVVAIDLDKNVEIEPIYINEYGYFEFRLINNRQYQLLVLGDNNLRVERNVELNRDTVADLFVRAAETNKPVVFEAVEFAKNSASVPDAIRKKLEFVGQFLERYPFCSLVIRGHTDSDGSPAANLKLSQQRADTIRELLLTKFSLDTSRVRAEGYGAGRPVAPNDSPNNKARNRRVEFEIVVPDDYKNYWKAHPPGFDPDPVLLDFLDDGIFRLEDLPPGYIDSLLAVSDTLRADDLLDDDGAPTARTPEFLSFIPSELTETPTPEAPEAIDFLEGDPFAELSEDSGAQPAASSDSFDLGGEDMFGFDFGSDDFWDSFGELDAFDLKLGDIFSDDIGDLLDDDVDKLPGHDMDAVDLDYDDIPAGLEEEELDLK
jgi:outer membrane protein OmpA-like peptidoglycan-associated protein